MWKQKLMTNKTRRTEIQIETHEVKVVRLRSRQALAHCGHCGEIVTALTPEQMAEVLETTQDDVFACWKEKKSISLTLGAASL